MRVKGGRRLVAGAAVVVAVPSIAIASMGSHSSSGPIVDAGSVGGRCSDGHSLAEARHAKTPWCTLPHAAAAAPSGAVVRVRRGTYPGAAFNGIRRPGWVTFEPMAHESVTLKNIDFRDSSHIRLEGFRVRPDHGAVNGIVLSDAIELARGDFAGGGILVRASRDVSIRDNRIHDITQEGSDSYSGYGIIANGLWAPGDPHNGLDGLRIVGNRILRVPQDGIQLGGEPANMRDITIARNEIGYVNASRAPGAGNHSDGIQAMGARGLRLLGNFVHNADECVLIKDDVSTGVAMENNVFVGSGPGHGHCVQVYDAPGAKIVNNTFWQESDDWPRALIVGSGGLSSPAGSIIRNNIIDKYDLKDAAGVDQDYNLIGDGPRRGRHDLLGLPRFGRGWQLAARSRGIDAGTATGAPARDRLGRPRHDDPAVADRGTGHVDIGAEERR